MLSPRPLCGLAVTDRVARNFVLILEPFILPGVVALLGGIKGRFVPPVIGTTRDCKPRLPKSPARES